jgi:hypothetical protein
LKNMSREVHFFTSVSLSLSSPIYWNYIIKNDSMAYI